ncbi:MAG: ABC transporter permease [Alphaproteobacteria bacterium]|nr:ABC transporter permease [Alphaproteobacteria bacterium]
MAARHAPAERAARGVTYALGVLGLAFLVAPILVIIPLSFNAESFFSYPMPGVSLRWYEKIAQSDAWRRALRNSLIVGLATTVIATLVGGLAALGLSRLRSRMRAVLVGVLISPMIIPGVIIALALFLFFSPLGLAGNLPGIIVAHTILGIPFVVITLTAALVNFDTNLMRAAASLGAGPITAYRRIMVPLMTPALVSSALFVFVTSFDEFIVTSFLAGPEQYTLPIQMWSGVHDDVTPTILAAATLFILASILLLVSVEVLRRRSERLAGRVGVKA